MFLVIFPGDQGTRFRYHYTFCSLSVTVPGVYCIMFQITDCDLIMILFKFQHSTGASCRVIQVRGLIDNEVYAVKEMSMAEAVNLQLWTQECQILQSLSHRNIVSFVDAYVDVNSYFIATEFCSGLSTICIIFAHSCFACSFLYVPRSSTNDLTVTNTEYGILNIEYLRCSSTDSGGTLLDKVIRMKSLSEITASRYLADILSAIHHMHSKKIVHRDLKAANIVFSHPGIGGILKIIDFGESLLIEDNETNSDCVGTIHYVELTFLLYFHLFSAHIL